MTTKKRPHYWEDTIVVLRGRKLLAQVQIGVMSLLVSGLAGANPEWDAWATKSSKQAVGQYDKGNRSDAYKQLSQILQKCGACSPHVRAHLLRYMGLIYVEIGGAASDAEAMFLRAKKLEPAGELDRHRAKKEAKEAWSRVSSAANASTEKPPPPAAPPPPPDGERSAGTSTAVCVPGQQVPCACPGGPQGAQACSDDGTRFMPCQCVALESTSPSVDDDSASQTQSAPELQHAETLPRDRAPEVVEAGSAEPGVASQHWHQGSSFGLGLHAGAFPGRENTAFLGGARLSFDYGFANSWSIEFDLVLARTSEEISGLSILSGTRRTNIEMHQDINLAFFRAQAGYDISDFVVLRAGGAFGAATSLAMINHTGDDPECFSEELDFQSQVYGLTVGGALRIGQHKAVELGVQVDILDGLPASFCNGGPSMEDSLDTIAPTLHASYFF